MVTKPEQLRGYFQKYPFLQSKHFTDFLQIPNSTIKMFVNGKRNLSEEKVDRINTLIESLDYLFVGWSYSNFKKPYNNN